MTDATAGCGPCEKTPLSGVLELFKSSVRWMLSIGVIVEGVVLMLMGFFSDSSNCGWTCNCNCGALRMVLFKCFPLLELVLVEEDRNDEVEHVEEDDNRGGKVRFVGVGEGLVDVAEEVLLLGGVKGDEST